MGVVKVIQNITFEDSSKTSLPPGEQKLELLLWRQSQEKSPHLKRTFSFKNLSQAALPRAEGESEGV